MRTRTTQRLTKEDAVDTALSPDLVGVPWNQLTGSMRLPAKPRRAAPTPVVQLESRYDGNEHDDEDNDDGDDGGPCGKDEEQWKGKPSSTTRQVSGQVQQCGSKLRGIKIYNINNRTIK